MLSRKGHCSSYDDVEAMDTSIANEIIAKSDVFGVVLPSKISTGVFVQVAGDNNDINEDTLDGKTPQHLSFFREVSSVLPLNRRSMQTKQRGNAQLNRRVCANISDSTVHMESVQLILVSPERHVMSGSNVTKEFGSLQDGSCLGIGKDDTNVLTMVICLIFVCVFFLQKRHRSSLWENMKYR